MLPNDAKRGIQKGLDVVATGIGPGRDRHDFPALTEFVAHRAVVEGVVSRLDVGSEEAKASFERRGGACYAGLGHAHGLHGRCGAPAGMQRLGRRAVFPRCHDAGRKACADACRVGSLAFIESIHLRPGVTGAKGGEHCGRVEADSVKHAGRGQAKPAGDFVADQDGEDH